MSTSAARVDIDLRAQTSSLQKDMRDAQRILRAATQTMKDNMDDVARATAEAGLSYRQLERNAERMKAAIDPLSAAEGRYAQELRIADAQLKQNMLSESQYSHVVELSNARLEKATEEIRKRTQVAGFSMESLEQAAVELKAQIDPLAAAQQRYAQEVARTNAMLQAGVISEGEHAQAIDLAEARLDSFSQQLRRGGASAGQMQAGMQQLSYNLNDVATMFSMNARPMQIFASQAGQVTQAIGLMHGKTTGFIGFMTGAWGAAIIGAGTILGSLAAAHFDAGEAAKTQEEAEKDLIEAIDQLREATERQMRSAYESIRVSLVDANEKRRNAMATREQAVAELELAQAKARAAGASVSAGAPSYSNTYNVGQQAAQESAARSIQTRIDKLNKSIADSDRTVREMQGQAVGLLIGEQFDKAAAAQGRFSRRQDELNASLANGEITLTEYANGLRHARATLEAAKDSTKKHTAKLSDNEKAYRKSIKATDSYIDQLQEEVDRIGLSSAALRQLEVSRELDAASTDQQRQKIRELNVERENALALEEARQKAKQATEENADFERNVLVPMRREAELLGMVGLQRERHALQMDYEAKRYPITIDLIEAELSGNTALAAAKRKMLDLLDEEHGRRMRNAEQADILDRERAKLDAYNASLRDTITLLDRVGGTGGGILAGTLGVLSGNYGAGRGALGELIGSVLNQATGDINADGSVRILADELRGVFGRDGVFQNTLTAALQGAGLGYAGATAILGKQSGASGFGSMAGGALGQTAGKELLSGVLGSFAGPFGSIAGGILGGVIGGLFKGTDTGVAVINGGRQWNAGNDSQRIGASQQALDGILATLSGYAGQFGNQLDLAKASGSLGMRDDRYTYDPTGQQRTKGAGVLRFDAQEDATRAAMQDLIQDGILGPLNSVSESLLHGQGSFEKRLEDALNVQNVFGALKAETDPLGSAIDALARKAADLRRAFEQGGAGAEDMVRLESYLAQQRQAMIDQASAGYRSTFYSSSENADFAKRQIRDVLAPLGYASVDTVREYRKLVDSIDTSSDAGLALYGTLMSVSGQFGALQKAEEERAKARQAKAARAEAVANTRGQLEVELLRAQGKSVEATALARKLELRAMDASLTTLQKEIYLELDIAAARQGVADAAARQKSELQQTIDQFGQLSDSLRDFRGELSSTAQSNDDYLSQLKKLQEVGRLASLADAAALADLPGVGREFLEAAQRGSSTLLDYQREVARVRRFTDSAIGASEGMVGEAQQQITLLDEQLTELGVVSENVLSVREAVERLQAVMENGPNVGGAADSGTGTSGGSSVIGHGLSAIERIQRSWEDRLERYADRADDDRLYSAMYQRRYDRLAERYEERFGALPTGASTELMEKLLASNVVVANGISDLNWKLKVLSPDGLSLRTSADDEA